jgi:3-deoxy-D-manno-octulosonic-acid transferase
MFLTKDSATRKGGHARQVPACQQPDRQSRLRPIVSRMRLLIADKCTPGFSLLYISKSSTISLLGSRRSIWFHGERPEQFNGVRKIIRAVREKAPQIRLVFTSGRPATVEWLAAKFQNDSVLPAPWDLNLFVSRFFRSMRPLMMILLESDRGLGTKALIRASKASIPLAFVNVKKRDAETIECFTRPFLSLNQGIRACVQDRRTAAILQERGLPGDRITVTGDLSFECEHAMKDAGTDYLRREIGIKTNAPVIIAEGMVSEEGPWLIDVFSRLRYSYPDSVLLLEPRYRRQISNIELLLRKRNLSFARRSRPVWTRNPAVLLFDRPGELPSLYSTGACFLAGGTFAGRGDPVDVARPASVGIPIIIGPKLLPDAKLARMFIAHGAALQVAKSAVPEKMVELLMSPTLSETLARSAKLLVDRKRGACQKTLQAIEPLIPSFPDEARGKQSWRIKRKRDLLSETAVWRKFAPFFMKRRIDDWKSLRVRLGVPRVILCLGNGPSSEDIRVRKAEHDCLMRVNWIWQRRGILVHPDIVFLYTPRGINKVSPCIYAFRNIDLEYAALLRGLLTRGPRPIEYFTMERISSLIREGNWNARPSNGALMIAAGAALQPERLIVAGMDLFLHPDGKYPGDLRANNEYAAPHDRGVDLEVIRSGLREYNGELIIISRALRESLAA